MVDHHLDDHEVERNALFRQEPQAVIELAGANREQLSLLETGRNHPKASGVGAERLLDGTMS